MAIYKIENDKIVPLQRTTFASEGIREENHLQKFIVNSIEVIDPGLFVIATEYSDWQDSRREIDILAIDKEANLIVIELKRDEDGGHMELQAVRYAAMVSNLKFQDAVEAYRKHCNKLQISVEDHEKEILDFLGWETVEEELFNADVKIILIAANFNKEITTSVLWLNDRDLDIRCISIAPQRDDKLYVEIIQQIPIKEAREYQVRQKEKLAEERKSRLETVRKLDTTKYNIKIVGKEERSLNKRKAMFFVIKEAIGNRVDPGELVKLTRERSWFILEGTFNTQIELEQAMKQTKPNVDLGRWFINLNDIFHFNNKTYILSNQFGGEFVKNSILSIFYSYPQLNGEIVEADESKL